MLPVLSLLLFTLLVLALLTVLDEKLWLVLFFLQKRGSMVMDSLADDEVDDTIKSKQRFLDQTPHMHQWSQAFFFISLLFF